MRGSSYVHTGLIRLLDADPDLVRGVEPQLAERLRRRVLAEVIRLDDGAWEPREHMTDGIIGALLLDGVVTRSATISKRRGVEFYGPGDIIRPAVDDRAESVQFRVEWTVHRPGWLALLGSDVQAAAACCPQVLSEILDRLAARESVAHSRALAQIPALDHRLLVLLWQLADRWGTVQRDGVMLELAISHTMLGDLAGAQRQSVSRALSRLIARGSISRSHAGWLLMDAPPTDQTPPESTDAERLESIMQAELASGSCVAAGRPRSAEPSTALAT